MPGITERLAAWSSALALRDVPPAAIAAAPRLLLDWLANAIGGTRAPSSAAMARFAEADAPRGDATAVGLAARLHPAYAALVNGQAAHVLESDDTHQESSSHPGSSVWSAVLAVGETTGASLGEAMTAAIVGYDVVGRLGAALGPAEHYARGFHPTGTCGALGCAAAVARLLELDADRTVSALGIALSQAAGAMEFLADGTWTKRFHPGWAAHSGITAAGLARAGFTGPASAIEGKAGFLSSHSASPRPEREHRLGADDVERVTIAVLGAGWDIIAEPRARKLAPESVVDAQFSMPYGAAVALVRGKASVREFTPEVLRDPAVRAAMKKVECVRDPALDARFPRQWPAWVEVRTRAGAVLRAAVEHPKGDPENPLAWDEQVAKLRDLVGDALPSDRLDEIARRLAEPDLGTPVRDLMALVRPT